MTKSGIKTEDYREINRYWFTRLVGVNDLHYEDEFLFELFVEQANIFEYSEDEINHFNKLFKPFTQNTMTLGYPKSTDTERILKFEHAGIEIRTGNPEWGAEPEKLYFVIKHGKRC